jgi:hypothetical protein
MLNAGTIIGGGFRLIREHPAAVAVWGLLYFLATALFGLVLRPAAVQAASAGDDPAAAMNAMQGMMGQLLLVNLAYVVLAVMLGTATQRAVLRPEQGGFFYLRLGLDELRMLGLALLLFVMLYVGILVLGLVLGLAMGVAVMSGGAGGAFAAAMVVYIAAMLAAVIWFEVRFSLAFPLTLLRGRIIIGEAWRLSRGRFWTLFLAYFALTLILMLVWAAIMAVTMGPYLSELIRGGVNPEALRAAVQAQMARQLGPLDAMTILGWALSAFGGALGLALLGGAIATAARELSVDRQGMAQTFG